MTGCSTGGGASRRPKRVPLATVEQVLGLYREKYFDLNVQHFHEKLGTEHGIELSYTWVKQALQGAGLVARGRKRGVHRKRRERRPLPGMLLHIDGSRHRWFQDERWYDLIVILDDATSEIYYAQLVEEESTATVMAGLRGSDRAQRRVLRAVQRSGQPFLADPEGGRQGRSASPDASGTGPARVGSADDPGLLAASAGTQRAQLRHLARTVAAGVAAARDHDRWRQANRFLREALHRPSSIAAFRWRRQQRATRFCPAAERSGPDLLPAVRAHREPRQHGQLSEPAACRSNGCAGEVTLAGCNVMVHQHLDGTLSLTHGPHCLGRYDDTGTAPTRQSLVQS